MTLNYQVTVESYPFLNEIVGGSIPVMKSSLYLMGKKTRQIGRKPRGHSPQGRQ